MPAIRQNDTQAFKAEYVRQIAAGARQTDVARTHGTSPERLAWQHLAARAPTELMLKALGQGLNLWQPAPGLPIHANRSSHFTSAACRARIDQASAQPQPTWQPLQKHPAGYMTQGEVGWSILKTESLPNGNPFA